MILNAPINSDGTVSKSPALVIGSNTFFAPLSRQTYLHHLSEQSELTISLAENEKKLAELQKTQVDMRMLYSGLREFTEVKKLTPMLVNKLIQRIEIHNNEKFSGYCFVQVDIYFTAVGLCNLQTAEKIAKLLEEAKAEQNSLKPA